MKISPFSTLVGALFAAVVFLSMAQTAVGTQESYATCYLANPQITRRIAIRPSLDVMRLNAEPPIESPCNPNSALLSRTSLTNCPW